MKPRTTEGMADRTSTQRLEDRPQAPGGDFGDIEGGRDAQRDGQDDGPGRDQERAEDERQDAELGRIGDGIPEAAAQEIARADVVLNRETPSRSRKTKIRATKTIEAMPLRKMSFSMTNSLIALDFIRATFLGRSAGGFT